MSGVFVLALILVASGLWFAQLAAHTGMQDAVLGRRFAAAPMGLLVAAWGLMYAIRAGRVVLGRRADSGAVGGVSRGR